MKNVKPGHKRPIVCLNAGHAGKANRSPVVPEYYESEMTWKLTNYQAEELEKYGIEVWKTREKQGVGMGLIERGKAAKGSDLWLSNHSNASDTESVDYPLAVYMVSDSGTQIDEQSKEIGKLLAQTIYEVMQTRQGPNTWSREAGRDIDGDGERNDEWYGELRGAHEVDVPGLILEHSFHSNKKMAKWLMQDANLKKLAAAEAKTVAAWFGITEPVEKPTPQAPSVPQSAAKIYRVQVGSFSKKANAEQKLRAVKAAGFEDAYVACVDGKLWRVQIGAFQEKADAEKLLAKVQQAGFSGYVTSLSGEIEQQAPAKSIDQLAREVILGKWGNGSDRKRRLTAAGHDYKAVQKRVNELLK